MGLAYGKFYRTLISSCSVVFALFFCVIISNVPKTASAEGPVSSRRLSIVATTGMIADIVAAVSKDRAKVRTLIGSGIDPHLFKPARSDVAKLLSADVIFVNGVFLEGRMTNAFERIRRTGRLVYAVTDLIDQRYLLRSQDGRGHPDPHLWMDPAAWIEAVRLVRDKLSEIDRDGRLHYEANAENYMRLLKQLDGYAERVLRSVPEQSRILVTAHDAFQYFGRRYGFRVVGIQGLSTESEAGIRDIEGIVDTLVKGRVRAVFVESTVSDRNIRALIEGCQARGHSVVIGGSLFSDAMGSAGTYEGTYVGMIDHNVTTIARSLGGDAPRRGMQGKLR